MKRAFQQFYLYICISSTARTLCQESNDEVCRILNSSFRLDGHFFDRINPMGVIFDQKLRFCIFEENKNIHERWGVCAQLL